MTEPLRECMAHLGLHILAKDCPRYERRNHASRSTDGVWTFERREGVNRDHEEALSMNMEMDRFAIKNRNVESDLWLSKTPRHKIMGRPVGFSQERGGRGRARLKFGFELLGMVERG
jgi:hypothetical protein